jgi:hypothetical protein
MNEEELVACDRQSFMSHLQLEYEYLFQLYLLANKLQDATVKNAAIIAVMDVTQMRSANNVSTFPSQSITKSVYEGTAEGSPARRLIMDIYSTLPLCKLLHIIRMGYFSKEIVNDLAKVLDEELPSKCGFVRITEIQNEPQKYLEDI